MRLCGPYEITRALIRHVTEFKIVSFFFKHRQTLEIVLFALSTRKELIIFNEDLCET